MAVMIVILLVIAAVLFAAVWCHITADLRLKDNKLTVVISNWFVRKRISVDLAQNKTGVKAKSKKDPLVKSSPINDKLNEIKQRIFSTEKGFDMDEAKKIKSELAELYSGSIGIIRDFLGRMRLKIHIPRLFIRLEYGTGDPAHTGMLYGTIWGAVGILYPPAARYIHLAYPMLDITPDFYGKRFDIEVRSIIKVRPAHIINASFSAIMGLAFTYLKNKFKKGSGKDGR